MRFMKELLVVLYVFILLFNDPQLTRAYGMDICGRGVEWAYGMSERIQPFADAASTQIRLTYVLNGGKNSAANPGYLVREKLPFALDVPTRQGYNFAGWYLDSSYTTKVTEINAESAGELILFAKWTRAIDNHYNVEMYSYQSAGSAGKGSKELKECSYGFLDDVVIPGMPSTRESDYLENIISSEAQCMQGLCFTPDYILMTSYTESNELPGSLLVFDRESGEYLVTLGMRGDSHLGGIAYDGENVWICHSNSKTLERLPYAYIQKIAEDAPGCCMDAAPLSKEYQLENKPSSITCYGGRIWVATYAKLFDSQMFSYSYDAASDQLFPVSRYNIPNKVQGIDFDENGLVYLSTSYGRNNSSYLKVYSSLLALTKHPGEPDMKVEMPPCSEQIAVVDDTVYVVFESASRKYFEGTDGNGVSTSPIDKVLSVTVASIW